ncbi:hypothetical protein HY405_02110 [Candidatus Microgenomates bacterium]|nr:hypothetical protein [Candidatus Microgenomates bacterium]
MERVKTRHIFLQEKLFWSLAYHDIFDFPLTLGELIHWESNAVSDRKFLVQKTGEYYHLPRRFSLALIRRDREKQFLGKIKEAKRRAHLLSFVPTIRFIGISGSLAMHNADKGSDIDLFIITTQGTMWITRVVVKILALFLGISLRQPQKSYPHNALCLNLWLDEVHYEIPENLRNIYTAHEVAQVIPLVNKGGTFEAFIVANSWFAEYWPSALPRFTNKEDNGLHIVRVIVSKFVAPLELLVYHLQLRYMQSRRTRELIEPGRAFFHPIDWKDIVLAEFNRRVVKYNQDQHFNFKASTS